MYSKLTNTTYIEHLAGIREQGVTGEPHTLDYYKQFIGLSVASTGFYGQLIGVDVVPLLPTELVFTSASNVVIVVEGRVDLSALPVNNGTG